MSVFKCTALFSQTSNVSGGGQGSRVGGWSESIYRETSDEAAMRSSFEELCRRRALMLAKGGAVVGQRYQKIDPVGRAVTGQKRYPGQEIWDTDVPQMALTFVMFSTTGINSRRFTLRGMPDIIVTEGEYSPGPIFTAALFDFVKQLSVFQFRARLMTAPRAPINIIDGSGNVQLAADLTVTPGTRVWISGVRVSLGAVPSDYYTVDTVTSARLFKLVKWNAGSGVDGTAETSSTIYPTIEFLTVESPTAKIVVRKVGRPFGAYRGRASKRV